MAILVSNGAGTTTFATASSWYRAEAANWFAFGQTWGTSLPSAQTYNFQQPITFANAGNVKGIVLQYDVTTVDPIPYLPYGYKVALDQNWGNPTISAANPCVVTLNSHGLANGQKIYFTTTGTLPSPITSGLEYYVINTATNTFQISLTTGGAAVSTNLSSQSGTHTLWVEVASKKRTTTDLINGTPCTQRACWIKPFNFDTFYGGAGSYAVTTTASLYQFSITTYTISTGYQYTSSGLFNFACSSGTTLLNYINYAVFCDNLVTYSDTNDSVIVRDLTTIDMSINPHAALANGNTTHAVSVVVCSSDNPVGTGTVMLQWATSPAAAYTWTIGSEVLLPAHAGFQMGTSGNPIPNAQQGVLVARYTADLGSYVGFRTVFGDTNAGGRGSIYLFGQVPTFERTQLTSKANIADQTLQFTSTSGLYAGDYLSMTKIIASADLSYMTYKLHEIKSVDSGTQVTLVTPVKDYARENAGWVMRPYKAPATITVAGTLNLVPTGAYTKTNYQYTFTTPSSSVTAGATYTSNGVTYTVPTTTSSSTTLITTGSGAPTASGGITGTLTLASGTGPATIAFTAWVGNPYWVSGSTGYLFYGGNNAWYLSATMGGLTNGYKNVTGTPTLAPSFGNSTWAAIGTGTGVPVMSDGSGVPNDYYGIKLTSDNPVYTHNGNLFGAASTGIMPLNFNMSGCTIEGLVMQGSQYMGKFEAAANQSVWMMQHNQLPGIIPKYDMVTAVAGNSWFTQLFPPITGMTFQYNNFICTNITGTVQGGSSVTGTINGVKLWEAPGPYNYLNNYHLGQYNTWGSYMAFNFQYDMENNYWDGYYSPINIESFASTFKNNYIWGFSNGSYALFYMGYPNVQAEVSGNHFNNCPIGIQFGASPVTMSKVWSGNFFGDLQANTTDIVLGYEGYCNVVMYNTSGNLTIDVSGQKGMVAGSALSFSNYNLTTNMDLSYLKYGKITRTGYGLADTTVWTGTAFNAASAGQFGMRFEPNDGTNVLSYQDNKGNTTIGNSQNKTVTVTARVKLNNAAYYAGTYTLPTLKVTYDAGTVVTNVAVATTAAQQLQVVFTPTTTTQYITIELDFATDATTTNAYVYVGELLVGMAGGISVDTTDFGSWSNSVPLGTTRTFQTPSSAWDEPTSAHTVTGSFGQSLSPVATGLVVSATNNTVTLASTAIATNNIYQYDIIQITGGAGAGQSRFIASYVGSTKVATLYSNWATNPDATSVYNIIPMGSIEHAVWDALTSNHTVAGSEGLQDNTMATTVATNLDTNVGSRLATTGYTAAPTLANIEASTVLAKEANVDTLNSLLTNVTYGLSALQTLLSTVSSNVNGKPTLTQIEGSTVLAKDSNVTGVGTAVSGVNTLLTNATYGLSALKTLIDLLETSAAAAARFTEIKGAGWTVETLKGIYNIVNTIDVTDLTAVANTLALVKAKTDTITWSDVTLIKNIEAGRWNIVNNQMIFYGPDNTTELFRCNLFDQDGKPSSDSVFDRRRA